MENRRLSLLYNLQNLYNASPVGSVDFQLSSYLIDHYKDIARINIFDISEDNNVSRATVRRFCSHLGYKNFKELKQHFSDFDEGFDVYHEFYTQDRFVSQLRGQIKSMFEELEERLSSKELGQIVESIRAADEVVIVASSTIANNIRVFQQTMAIFGKRISLVVSEKEFQEYKNRLTSKSLILFFSISGVLAETFIDQVTEVDATTYLFTNSRQAIFNQCFDKIYHLTSMGNAHSADIIYYTYGITLVLDTILHEYHKLK